MRRCNRIKGSIENRLTDEAERVYQVGYCPETELIYGVKMQGASRLFYGLGPSIAERDKYANGGQGVYLADFIAGRTYEEHLTLCQCVVLAAYILYEAKENVVGCGGDSHIAILREGGTSGLINWHDIERISEFLRQADRYAGQLLLHAANFNLTDEQFKSQTKDVLDTLELFRNAQQKEIDKHQEMLESLLGVRKENEDEFGFYKRPFMPLGSETSEPEQ